MKIRARVDFNEFMEQLMMKAFVMGCAVLKCIFGMKAYCYDVWLMPRRGRHNQTYHVHLQSTDERHALKNHMHSNCFKHVHEQYSWLHERWPYVSVLVMHLQSSCNDLNIQEASAALLQSAKNIRGMVLACKHEFTPFSSICRAVAKEWILREHQQPCCEKLNHMHLTWKCVCVYECLLVRMRIYMYAGM